ncbi:hypothetical protein [Paenibacillus donghaensis]|nr:hypothetical protein [Paenibacillus donghaensis]
MYELNKVWLEHAAVCESEAELADYLAKAKQTHHLRSLESTNIQGGSIYE